MTTKRDLIASALAELGLGTYIFDATPEQLQEALSRMNRMAAMWDGLLVRLGYNLGGGLDDAAGIPDTAEECFVTQLSLRIAPTFGKTASQETRANAARALTALLATNAKRPEMPYPSYLPKGRGNRVDTLNRPYFPDTCETPGLDEGATEY